MIQKDGDTASAMTRNEWSRRQLLKAAGAAGLGLAATTLGGGDAAGAAVGVGTTQISSATAKLGVFAEPNRTTETTYFQAFTDFQSEINRAVAVYRTYRSWGQSIFNSTIGSILNPDKNNFLPTPELYLSFHAYHDKKGTKCISWSEIAGGCYDADIDTWITALAQLLDKTGHAYVAFHHEMENQEGTPPIGCGSIGTKCGTADDFKAAYWHFRARVQDGLQALYGWPPEAITWVITYMGNSFRGMHGGPDTWWPTSADPSYVPGVADDHLVGVDVYNRFKCHNKPWYTFEFLAGPPQAFAAAKGRNLFIGECGTVEGNACGGDGSESKAVWFADALNLMKTWGNLEAFCYSQVSGFNAGDFRIDTSSDALAAFQTLANDPFFS